MNTKEIANTILAEGEKLERGFGQEKEFGNRTKTLAREIENYGKTFYKSFDAEAISRLSGGSNLNDGYYTGPENWDS